MVTCRTKSDRRKRNRGYASRTDGDRNGSSRYSASNDDCRCPASYSVGRRVIVALDAPAGDALRIEAVHGCAFSGACFNRRQSMQPEMKTTWQDPRRAREAAFSRWFSFEIRFNRTAKRTCRMREWFRWIAACVVASAIPAGSSSPPVELSARSVRDAGMTSAVSRIQYNAQGVIPGLVTRLSGSEFLGKEYGVDLSVISRAWRHHRTRKGSDTIRHQNSPFYQILQLVPWARLDALVDRHGADGGCGGSRQKPVHRAAARANVRSVEPPRDRSDVVEPPDAALSSGRDGPRAFDCC